jgi:hypothetical protein
VVCCFLMGNPTNQGKRKRKSATTSSSKTSSKDPMWSSSSKKKRGSSSTTAGVNADNVERLFHEIADEDDDQVAGMEGRTFVCCMLLLLMMMRMIACGVQEKHTKSQMLT